MYSGGLVLICLGVIFLLRNLGIIKHSIWPILWPSILIAIGIELIIYHRKIRRFFK